MLTIMCISRITERGNILFLILLAVVLFAALSYAVTQSMRGGGKDGSSETADTLAADILNYAALVENEVQRMMLVNGPAYNQIDFYNPYSRVSNGSGGYGSTRAHNPNCSPVHATKPCIVFKDSSGSGSIPPRNFEEASNMAFFYTSGNPVAGDIHFVNQIVENVGTSASDILMIVVDLKIDVCDSINTKLGLPLASTYGNAAWGTFGNLNYWSDAANYSLRLPANATGYIGQRTFCMRHQVGGNIFVHVLIAR